MSIEERGLKIIQLYVYCNYTFKLLESMSDNEIEKLHWERVTNG